MSRQAVVALFISLTVLVISLLCCLAASIPVGVNGNWERDITPVACTATPVIAGTEPMMSCAAP